MKTPRATSLARGAGRALLGAASKATTNRRFASSARCARPRSPARAARRSCDRIADPRVTCVTLDRHREGLLSRSGERAPRLRAPRHRARPRASGGAALRVGLLVAALDARRETRRRRAEHRLLRQPAAQRPRASRGWCASSRSAATRRSPTGSRRTRRFPARWSIASCRRRPTRTSPRSSDGSASHDAAPVVAEPYNQWVIEDRFVAAATGVGVGGRDAGSRRSSRSRR